MKLITETIQDIKYITEESEGSKSMYIVGPYMVLLHTSWKFNGLAGATTLLTVIIVVSGFVGRYIFTRIPRTMDGLEIEGTLSQEALKQARRLMALWHAVHIPIGMALFVSAINARDFHADLYGVSFDEKERRLRKRLSGTLESLSSENA